MATRLIQRILPILDSFGERFGLDARYFAKNSAMVTFSHGIAVLKGIVTGYLVTRLFPPAMYGEYKFVLGVIGMVGFIGLPGLPSALAGAIARKEPVSLSRIAGWFCSIVSIGAVLIIGCIALLPRWGREELWPLFLIAGLLFVPSALSTNLYGGVIRGLGAFTTAFRASLISNVLITISVLAMLLIKPSPLLLLALITGIPAIVYIAGLIPFQRRFRTDTSQSKIKRTALHMSVATIPSTISWYLDSLIISAYFGLNQLALFSVSLLIPEQIKVWTKELLPVVFSKQAKGKDTPDRRHKMHVSVIIGMAIFGVGILLYVMVAPFIMPILFPLYPAEELTRLTSIAAITLIVAPASLYPQFLEARGLVKELHWANWISSAAFAIALFSLIPTLGLMGAIISRGVFRFSYAICSFVIVQRTPTETD
jgi:O-antigen/teichoic acid export membrane protein